MNRTVNFAMNLPNEHIMKQLAAIQRTLNQNNWYTQVPSSLIAIQNTFASSDWYQQIANITSFMQTLQERFVDVSKITSHIDDTWQQQMQMIQSSAARISQLQTWLSQLTEQEFQRVQDEFEPSDELIEALDTTFEQAANIDNSDVAPTMFQRATQHIQTNFWSILAVLISLYSLYVNLQPNPQLQTLIEQNKESKCQNAQEIEQNKEEIELTKKGNHFLEHIANTLDLLVDDSDVVRNALDTLSDQEQTVAVEPDEAVHSPAQDQNVDCQQENGD